MKRKWFALGMIWSVLVFTLLLGGDAVAQQHFRVSRPDASGDDQSSARSADQNSDRSERQNSEQNSNSNIPSAPLKATAVMNDEMQQAPSGTPSFMNTVYEWEAKNNPNMHASSGTEGSAHHHGLKSHLGGALLAVAGVAGSVAGSVAKSYGPVVPVSGHTRGAPVIKVDAGHCPAAFDPAFQIPVRWWDVLSQEEGDPYLGPQWKLWLQAVQEVFAARAPELKHTPGAAALHVIVNPNGTIFNLSPYTGNERSFQNLPPNAPTLYHLRDMVAEMRMFPPFPAGSKVRCYHLIIDGSAGM